MPPRCNPVGAREPGSSKSFVIALISSGLIGLAMTALVGQQIGKATKALNVSGALKMPENMQEKAQQVINKTKSIIASDKTRFVDKEAAKLKAMAEEKSVENYEKTAKNVFDKFFQPVFMPLRASVTIMAVPHIMNILGMNKKGKKPEQKQEQSNVPNYDYKICLSENEKVLFQSFSGGAANHANK